MIFQIYEDINSSGDIYTIGIWMNDCTFYYDMHADETEGKGDLSCLNCPGAAMAFVLPKMVNGIQCVLVSQGQMPIKWEKEMSLGVVRCIHYSCSG